MAPAASSEADSPDSMSARKIVQNATVSQITKAVVSEALPPKTITENQQQQSEDAVRGRNGGPIPTEEPQKILKLKDMPGPWPSVPFIGTSWQYFPGNRYSLTNIYESHVDKYKRYGPIMKEEFQWGKPVVQLFDPIDFEKVFKSQGRNPVRPISEFLVHYRRHHPEKYDSAGLANTLGEEWARLRKTVAPVLLRPKAISFLLTRMNGIADDFIELLRAKRNPDTFIIEDFKDMAYKVALEGVYMMSLDTRLGCLETDIQENSAASDMILSVKLLFESFHELYYGLPFWKLYETESYKKLDRAESLMYNATSKQIQDAVENLRNSNADEDGGVLRTLLLTNELSDKELIVSVIDLISGGIFTVANSISFLLYHIAKNHEVQQKLYEEICSVMTDSEITNERLANMPYLKACVQEAFRLSPTIPCINRILPKDTILSGYLVPAGTEVFCNFPIPCMQADRFPEPQRFYPDRWMDTSAKSKYMFTLMPFGFGPRMCIGKRFAEMEMYITLAKLVHKFELQYTGQEVEVKSAFILVPANPISIILKDR